MNQRGYILLPVVVTITLLAAIAFLVNRESGMEVNLVAGELDGARAQYVAEAGLQHANWLSQNSACTGFALPATAFGDHNYSAAFTPTGGSPVNIAATGVLASGATRTLNRQNVPVYEAPTTVTLQLDNVTGGDVALDAFFNTRNHGANYSYVSTNPSQIGHQLIQFDLSSITTNVKVISAKLEVYQYSVSAWDADAAVSVHRVTRGWLEGTKQGGGTADGATWDTWDGFNPWTTPGGDYDPKPVASSPIINTNNVWVAWPVEELVQGWLSGTHPNQGLLLKGSGTLWVNLAPDEENFADIRPKLTITYACECGGGSGSTTVLQPANGRDTYMDDGTPTTNYGSTTEMRISNKINSQKRGLLDFNLDSIPGGAIVTSAVLELNLEGIGSGGTATVDVHRMLEQWGENQANWNRPFVSDLWDTPGGDVDPIPFATAAIDATLPGPTQWDITPIVTGWLDNTYNDAGLMLMGSPEVNHADFSTSDHADPGLHPKLTVSYSCPCGGCGVVVPPLPGYRDEFNSNTCLAANDYTGSDGVLDWSGLAWTELGDTGDPCNGNTRVADDSTVPQVGSWRANLQEASYGIEREADLSSYSVATLNFDYRRRLLDSPADYLSVQVSPDGGGSWIELDRLAGPADDPDYLAASYDITPHIAANTRIRLLATNINGSSGERFYLDNVEIIEMSGPPPPIGPGTPILEADASVFEKNPTTNYGSDPEVQVGRVNAGGGKYYATALRFNVSTLPPTAIVTSATLRLYQTGSGGTGSIDIGVYKADAAWNEGTVTWNTLSDDTIQHALTNMPLGTAGWYGWDLPPGLVHEWRDVINHGLVLRYEGATNGLTAKFGSKENATSAHMPQLLLEYTE